LNKELALEKADRLLSNLLPDSQEGAPHNLFDLLIRISPLPQTAGDIGIIMDSMDSHR